MLLTGRSVALMRFATWPSVVRSRRALTMRAAASLLLTSSVTCQGWSFNSALRGFQMCGEASLRGSRYVQALNQHAQWQQGISSAALVTQWYRT